MQFLKSLLSAQFASVIDFALTILLSSLLGVYYVAATMAGAVAGGVANCIVNYRWVFPDSNVRKTHVAMKYALVWLGSIMLNTLGTYFLTECLVGTSLLQLVLGEHVSQVYIVSKLVVAISVAFLWNYQMYRLFVYRNLHLMSNENNV